MRLWGPSARSAELSVLGLPVLSCPRTRDEGWRQGTSRGRDEGWRPAEAGGKRAPVGAGGRPSADARPGQKPGEVPTLGLPLPV